MKSLPAGSLVVVVLWLGGPTAPAIIFFDSGDPAHNREVAPEGAWAGAGWHCQGEFKNHLGTMISPRHFVTARHLGLKPQDTTFVHRTFFSGEIADRTYHINPNANGGTGYWDIAGTDLRVFEVYGDFPAYAPLYSKSDEAGREVVMMGRGRPRGAEVTKSGQTRGWLWGPHDRKARWGVNRVDAIESHSAVGDLLVTDFDAAPGTEECHAAHGDSGGALFIRDGGTWKLAGIFYAVDGRYDTNSTCGDASDFEAAMFDASQFFVGSDSEGCDGWELAGHLEDTLQSRAFASRISSSTGLLQPITQPAIDDAAKTPRERYDDWISGFGSGLKGLPGEDADRDGWANVLEYFAALDPTAVDQPRRPFLVEDAGETIRFTVRVRLDASARGLSWEIHATDDLVNQTYLPVTGLMQAGLARSLTEGVSTWQYEIAKPAGSRMFYRLEVTLAP